MTLEAEKGILLCLDFFFQNSVQFTQTRVTAVKWALQWVFTPRIYFVRVPLFDVDSWVLLHQNCSSLSHPSHHQDHNDNRSDDQWEWEVIIRHRKEEAHGLLLSHIIMIVMLHALGKQKWSGNGISLKIYMSGKPRVTKDDSFDEKRKIHGQTRHHHQVKRNDRRPTSNLISQSHFFTHLSSQVCVSLNRIWLLHLILLDFFLVWSAINHDLDSLSSSHALKCIIDVFQFEHVTDNRVKRKTTQKVNGKIEAACVESTNTDDVQLLEWSRCQGNVDKVWSKTYCNDLCSKLGCLNRDSSTRLLSRTLHGDVNCASTLFLDSLSCFFSIHGLVQKEDMICSQFFCNTKTRSVDVGYDDWCSTVCLRQQQGKKTHSSCSCDQNPLSDSHLCPPWSMYYHCERFGQSSHLR